jgi:hypothetical protein
MSTPIGCLFTSTSLYVWSGVQLLGWVLPFFITLLARYRDPVTKEWVAEAGLVIYSFYLYLCLALLYILQIAMGQMQQDPFCPYVYNYGFPALCPFYIGLAIGLTLFLPIFMNFYYSIVTGLTILACIWIAPALVLVWFSFHTPSQVGLSLGMGVLVTLVYLMAFKFLVMPQMPYVLNQPPCTWLGLTETWFSSDEQQQATREVKQTLMELRRRSRRRGCCC